VHCAASTCKLNSECGAEQICLDGECVTNCLANRDCPAAAPHCVGGRCVTTAPDGGIDTSDGANDTASPPPDTAPPPPDTTSPPPDTSSPPPDTTSPPPDGTTPGTGRYLDHCTGAADCASGLCTGSAPQFCTKACTVKNDCAHGQICSAAHACVLDDSGTPCDPTTAAPCAQYCFGSPASAQCTHECTSASDCAAGFACSAASGKKICVNIEIPCNTADDCPSGLGFCGASGVGCTATCSSASDCPSRLLIPGLSPYTCALNGGKQVCVPPADVLGASPLGTSCNALATSNTCRSGACDDVTTPASCAQRCTERGGCPTGFGCGPEPNGGVVSLTCARASGTAWLGEACAHGSDCATGLCRGATATTAYCTRLCVDGLCPTGLTCTDLGLSADDGTPIKMCSL
jgi:hypothetical protein